MTRYREEALTRRRFLARSAAGVTLAGAGPLVLSRWARAESTALDGASPALMEELIGGIHWFDYVPDRVALTFDDGPRPRTTPRVLKVLAANDIKGTFFICGRLVRRFPKIFEDVVAAGHQLANHTWSHPNLAKLSAKEIAREFDRTQDIVNETLGREQLLRYYRPPYGSPWYKNNRSAERARQRICEVIDARHGLLCMWQVHSNDSHPGVTEASIYKSMRMKFDRKKAGAMVFHDSSTMTSRNLPEYLKFIRGYGLRFTTIDELVEYKYGCKPEQVANLATRLRPARG